MRACESEKMDTAHCGHFVTSMCATRGRACHLHFSLWKASDTGQL